MQTPLLRCTLLSAAIGSLLAAPVQASEWNGSYIANGQCFCAGVIDSSVRNQLVPTPIGGQSVEQICDRIGDGPKLTKSDGTYNFPVYADPQCGHGPASAGTELDYSCLGAYEPGVDCQSAGPAWDVQAMYGQVPAITEEVMTTAATTVSVVTGGSRYIDPASFKAADINEPVADTTVATPTVETEASAEVSTYVTPQLATSTPEIVEPVDTEKSASRAARAEQLLAEQQQKLEVERKAAWDEATATAIPSQETQIDKQANAVSAKATEDARLAKQAKDAAAEARLAEQARLDEEAKLAEQARIDEEAKLAEQARLDEEAKLAEQANAAAEAAKVKEAAEAVAETNSGSTSVAPLAALQLPAGVRTNYNDFEYVQALPMGYDFGGGGMALAGSYSALGKWHYVAQAGFADTYKEIFLGAGYYLTPPTATRMTVVATAGLEHGRFDLSSGALSASDSDTGVALSLASRFVVNRLVELQAGVGYSSFFDGDIHFLGGGFIHINKQLDLTSQFEIGDNDSFGVGIRYYY